MCANIMRILNSLLLTFKNFEKVKMTKKLARTVKFHTVTNYYYFFAFSIFQPIFYVIKFKL